MAGVLKKACTVYLYTAVPMGLVYGIYSYRRNYIIQKQALLAQDDSIKAFASWKAFLLGFIFGFLYPVSLPATAVIEHRSS